MLVSIELIAFIIGVALIYISTLLCSGSDESFCLEVFGIFFIGFFLVILAGLSEFFRLLFGPLI